MELDDIQSALVCYPVNGLQRLVDKQTDGLHKRGQLTDDGRCLFRKDVARGFLEKNKPEGIGAGINCQQRVLEVRYTADFYFYHC